MSGNATRVAGFPVGARPNEAPTHPQAFSVANAVGLTVVGGETEAEALCGLLRANGIECFHRQTDYGAGAADGGASWAGPTEVVVDGGDLEAARKLLPRR